MKFRLEHTGMLHTPPYERAFVAQEHVCEELHERRREQRRIAEALGEDEAQGALEAAGVREACERAQRGRR